MKTKTLLIWHKRFGLASAVFVIVLSLSGILLNHANSFGLDSLHTQSQLLLKLYNIPAPTLRSTLSGYDGRALVASELNRQVFIEQVLWHTCTSPFRGAQNTQNYTYIACTDSVAIFTHSGEKVDAIDSLSGLTAPIEKVGLCDKQLCLQAAGVQLSFDESSFSLVPLNLTPSSTAEWVVDTALSASQEKQLRKQFSGATISWERIIQDVHAGRFMGPLGPWLMDAIALLFLILAGSGVMIWLRKEQKKKVKS